MMRGLNSEFRFSVSKCMPFGTGRPNTSSHDLISNRARASYVCKKLAVATPAMAASSAGNDRLHKAALICHHCRISRAGSQGFRRGICPCHFRKSSPPSLAGGAYWDHGGGFNYSLKLGAPARERVPLFRLKFVEVVMATFGVT